MERELSRAMARKRRRRKVYFRRFLFGLSILLLIFLAGFCLYKTGLFRSDDSTKESIDKKTAEKTDPSGTAYFTSDGTRVINWENISVPEWITRDLIPVNEYSRPGEAITDIKGIVVHYTANPGSTAKQNRDYFANLANGTEGRYASSHFVIDQDGTILQCIPMSEISYASNDRNYDTISIECCHNDETGEFTKATYESLVKLCAWLSDTYLIMTDDMIRHYDVTGKLCPKYFVDHEDAWEKFKMDVVKSRTI